MYQFSRLFWLVVIIALRLARVVFFNLTILSIQIRSICASKRGGIGTRPQYGDFGSSTFLMPRVSEPVILKLFNVSLVMSAISKAPLRGLHYRYTLDYLFQEANLWSVASAYVPRMSSCLANYDRRQVILGTPKIGKKFWETGLEEWIDLLVKRCRLAR